LVNAMTDVGKQNTLKGITVCHMHTEGTAPYTDPSCEGKIILIIVSSESLSHTSKIT